MESDAQSRSEPPRKKCQFAEMVQYRCNVEQDTDGAPRVHCLPIPRIFRICPGRPAVEMTRFIDVDLETGAVHVPTESSRILPKGKVWRDVMRYDVKIDEA